ncbi:MAG: glycoside hydrolase family 31 protein [Ferruginibacter sp.]
MNNRLFFYLALVITFFPCAVNAQVNFTNKNTILFSGETGSWSFTRYPFKIIKVTYKPGHYRRNENITDAVILKPAAANFSPGFITRRGDRFLIGSDSINIKYTQDSAGYNGFSITLGPNEKIFGGGERALPMNRRGYKFDLYNNPWYGYGTGADNLNFSVPFFTSSAGYGFFFDNASKGYADIGKTDKNIFAARFASGEINVYIIPGKDYKEILSSYYKLTGTQPLPPRWALGNFMSRFGYESEAQVNEIAARMRREKVPFDAVIYDLFWFGDSIKRTMGNLDWVNQTKWPAPKKMMQDFKKGNINSILITEPFILENTKMFNAAEKYFAVDSAGNPFRLTNFYFGYGGILDVFRKDAANWIWTNHYKKQIDNGVAGWWTDLGEPEKHPSAIMHNLKDLGFKKRMFGADEVHNVYGHYWNKMLYENYAKAYPGQRLFHLNRSGFSGSQRYSIFPWSGDVSRSWNGLQAQMPLMLGMSMSGIPYIHADAGGFAGGEGDNELYVRWLQFAAFTPIFRPHGTALYDIDTSAFSFPSEPALIDTPWRTYAKDVVQLRYNFLPYNYTLAYKQTSKGAPLVAPLYYYYPNDTTAANLNDEFMYGENILVSPVTEKGAAERKLYLPEGKWYGLFDSTLVRGRTWLNKKISIKSIPVYVKAGSFIPVWARFDGDVKTTSEYKLKDVHVIYFPSPELTTGILYEDDGETRNGVAEVLSFSGITVGDKIMIEIRTNNKALYNNGFKRILKIGSFKNVAYPEPARINGKKIKSDQLSQVDFQFNKERHFTFAQIEFNGSPLKLEIKTNEN